MVEQEVGMNNPQQVMQKPASSAMPMKNSAMPVQKKKVPWILIVALIIAVLGVGGYFLARYLGWI